MTDAKDRPILMSAPMVRATLREVEKPGTGKTQTRRIATITAIMGNRVSVGPHEELVEMDDGEFARGFMHYRSASALSGPYPIGYAVGDRAWVREAWAYDDDGIVLRAGERPFSPDFKPRWRSPIHMPRRLSRLTLLIEDVRVQRLQDISEADARAEGCAGEYGTVAGMVVIVRSPIEDFRDIWNSIHGPGAWGRNPWVVALTFRPILANIDSLKDAA